MKLKVKVTKNTYLANCTITQLIHRTRKSKYEEDYDLVEVECENWMKIRNIYFDGGIAIPRELEVDEIVTWDVMKMDNSKNDISTDVNEIRNEFERINSNIATHEIKELFKDLQKFFEEEVELLTLKTNNKKGTIKENGFV